MKRVILSAIVLIATISATQAQGSFYEGLAKYAGEEFQVYLTAHEIEGKEGHYQPGKEFYKTSYTVVRMESGLAYDVTYLNEKGRDYTLGSQIGDYYVDHQTYPSLLRHKYTGDGYVFIDDMLIALNDISKDGSTFESIGRISAVVKEVVPEATKEDEPKKKLTMKEKIAAAKEKMSSAGVSPRVKGMMNLNLNEVITTYLADMKKKQAGADAAQEAKYIAEIKNADAAFLAKRQSQSRELADKMVARDAAANGESGSNYTIKNNSNASVKLITDSGSTSTLNAGSSTTFLCQTDVFYCIGTSDKGGLIANGDDSCGQTITLE